MPLFSYQALNAAGAQVEGDIEAADQAQAATKLQASGLLVVMIEAIPARLQGLGIRRGMTASQADVTRFTDQLATLLEAGQPLEAALALQTQEAGTGALAQVLASLLERVKGGSSLSAAMEQAGGCFNPFYLSLVRAGEASGTLASTLSQLASILERTRQLRSELLSALIYPAFLVVGVLGSLMLLLTYVVPQFVPVFEELNVPLPLVTQCILWVGQALAQAWVYLLAIGLVAGVSLAAGLRSPNGRVAIDARALRIRGLGPLLVNAEVARMALALGTLLDRKVSLLNSLRLARQVVTNRTLASALDRATDSVADGRALSAALAEAGIFPHLAVQMIRVGEQSGQLAKMLLKLANFYDKQTQTTLKRLMAALVPLLTLLMTVVVAAIMLSIMLPLMSLTNNL